MNYATLSIIQKIAFKAYIIRNSCSVNNNTRHFTETGLITGLNH